MTIENSKDKAAIKYVIRSFYCETKGDEETLYKTLMLIDEFDFHLVARDGDRVIGGGGIIRGFAEYFWVDKEYRMKNVGGLIFRRALKETNGKMKIGIKVEDAHKYTRVGFVPTYYIMERRELCHQ